MSAKPQLPEPGTLCQCGERFFWELTTRGERIAVDQAPSALGNIEMRDMRDWRGTRAFVHDKGRLPNTGVTLYANHAATCRLTKKPAAPATENKPESAQLTLGLR